MVYLLDESKVMVDKIPFKVTSLTTTGGSTLGGSIGSSLHEEKIMATANADNKPVLKMLVVILFTINLWCKIVGTTLSPY